MGSLDFEATMEIELASYFNAYAYRIKVVRLKCERKVLKGLSISSALDIPNHNYSTTKIHLTS